MSNLFWFVIIYWLISVAIGLYAGKFVKDSSGYANAGRALPMYVVTATVFATWFGSETVLGIPASFLKDGIGGVVTDPFGASLCLILVGLFFARKLYRMNLLTLGDFYREQVRPHRRGADGAGDRDLVPQAGSARRSRRWGSCSTSCPAAKSARPGARSSGRPP